MRGGKSLADRGMIPRLLSGIYRKSRKLEKDTEGGSTVAVSMSYYEIYNDRVFDLFEAPENRTMTGLQLRDNGGKTVVVGLTERPCETLKEFEKLYDQANVNRSTSATKVEWTTEHYWPRASLTLGTAQRSLLQIPRRTLRQACDHNRRSNPNQYGFSD